jgi:hypothetical protein
LVQQAKVERHETGQHRVAVEVNENVAAVDAAVSVFWLLPHYDASVAVFSLSGTHVMIHMSVDSLDHMAADQSKSTQHQEHPLRIFSEMGQVPTFSQVVQGHGDQSVCRSPLRVSLRAEMISFGYTKASWKLQASCFHQVIHKAHKSYSIVHSQFSQARLVFHSKVQQICIQLTTCQSLVHI